MAPKADLESLFVLWLRMFDLPEPEQQYKFHPTRKWKFDFCWPDQKVAVEIEGITPEGGRHQRWQGFMGDAEKYEAALRLGWRVYRVPGPWLKDGNREILRPEVMETLHQLLGKDVNND